ncbi:MAG: GNAT family N-acetyltransferase [Planctomycetes bacterium]|nr:GNAT family N-acetyltransferase [Planctomycetota bacterium]
MNQSRGDEIQIRPARPDDLPAVIELLRPYIEAGRLLPRAEDEAPELLENGFVAETAGRIVGFAALDVYCQKLAEIRSLAVASEFQGSGIGRRLVEACVERARQLRVREVMAITSADGFFKSCGFDFALPGERKALFIQTNG